MKTRFFAILHALYVLQFISWFNRRKVSFICYHSVLGREQKARTDPFELQIPVELFRKNLDYIKRHHHVIPLNDFIDSRNGGRSLPEYSVVLMFDDGFE